MIGTTISHHRIVEKLGAGGMGEVYLADDTELGRRVAIKFIPSTYVANSVALERFKREARSAAALNHPNIIVVHDIGTHDGRPYIVMEHVDGEPLSKSIERGDLTIDRALDITEQILDGLAAAHEAGVIHRDLKPDNILIGQDGRVRILDFGLAKLRGSVTLTGEDTAVGTVHFMSPEQARGGAVDGRSDLFSVGIILYEMLAGRRPFAGEHPHAILYAITTENPPPLRHSNSEVRPGVERLVARLLEKNPERRYPSAKAALTELRRERGTTPRRTWTRRRGVSALALAAVIAATAWMATTRNPSQEASTAANVAHGRSIAVLPFLDMSPAHDQEYFSDGLAEELTNVLVKIPDLKVTGRSSAFSFKGKNEDLRVIGEKLGVEHILEGSVRKSGDKIRIRVQLVETTDGFQVWAQDYDRTLDDIFAVQDDIARSVARELQVAMHSTGAAARRPTSVAYDLVLQARYILQNPTSGTIQQAREILERSLELSPDYAPTWTEMALIHFREYELAAAPGDRQRANEAARQMLSKALELDPDLAPAHARMSSVQRRAWDFAGAQSSVDRALALEPGNPIVTGNAAFLHYALGRTDEAIALYRQTIRVDPLILHGYWFLAESFITAGQLDSAMTPLHRLRERSPDYWPAYLALGNIHLLEGDAEQARGDFARLQVLHPGDPDDAAFYRAIVEHTAQNSAASAAATGEFENRTKGIDPFRCAQIRAWRGEIDAAFLWLEKAYAVHDPLLHSIKTDVYLRPLHADPRWSAFLGKIGIPED